MKTLKNYITEEQNFLVNKKLNNRQDKYEYHPCNKNQLYEILLQLLKKGETNLNCIDVSKVEDMSKIFADVNEFVPVKDIDISDWNVSNVTDMYSMFAHCTYFNSDLSNWNVANVTNMTSMFYECHEFNSDLSKWDVSNVSTISFMFVGCKKFNSDLSNWKIFKNCHKLTMFYDCTELEKNNLIPDWYIK